MYSWFPDIIECLTDNGGCTDVCNNVPGSYQCECDDTGYELDSDKHSCVGKNWAYSHGNYYLITHYATQILMNAMIIMVVVIMTVSTLMVATTVLVMMDMLWI